MTITETESDVRVDPVTQQVLEGAFSAICDEMGDVTIQTGNSSVLVDGRDFSCDSTTRSVRRTGSTSRPMASGSTSRSRIGRAISGSRS